MLWNEAIFRKNDIRGIYKKDFDLSFVKKLALSFIHFYNQENFLSRGKTNKQRPIISVGHDCRLSSPEIARYLTHSLMEGGAEVRFLGMLTSPACFFSSHFFKDIKASIMVTASHNPPEFNGFKIILNKKNICDERLLTLKKIIKENLSLEISHKGMMTNFDVEASYIDFHKKKIKKPKKKNSLSIAIDCGNGASGPLAQKIFQSIGLPIQIHWLYTKPDGRFPHHPPDPSEEKNLKKLQKTIKEKQCDFGAAFDGDGDRLFIVGKEGKIFHGDELMSIFIPDILKKNPAAKEKPIVTDVKCADWFFDFLRQQKVRNIVWKSGHSLIRQKTLEEKALFGGELSGHFFFCDENYPIDDGLYALLRLIRIYFEAGNKSLEEMIPKERKSIETNEIRVPTNNLVEAKKKLEILRNHYRNTQASCHFIDGVRVSFPKQAWGLARLSNTQSEWTFRFGGSHQKNIKDLQKHFYQLLKISSPKVFKS